MRGGVILSIVVLAAGSFSLIGASANSPLISSAFGLSAIGIGGIASVAYFGALVASRSAGRYTDKVGPVPVILLGLLALAAGNVLAGLALHPAWLLSGMFMAGLGYGSVNPATSVLSNPSTVRRRGILMSIKQSGVPLGGLVAGAVLPVIGVKYGWRSAFAVSALLCLFAATFVSMWHKKSTPKSQAGIVKHQGKRNLRAPWGYMFGLLIAGVQVSIFAFMASYLVDARGASASAAGLGVSLLLVGGVVGRIFWGWLSDMFPLHRIAFLEVIGVLGAGMIALLVVVPDLALPPTLVILGVCSVGWNGVYIAAVSESAVTSRVGTSTGVALTFINAGAILCPILVGALIFLTASWTYGLLSLTALSVASSIVAYFGSKKSAKKQIVQIS